jgi:hypothetical protein
MFKRRRNMEVVLKRTKITKSIIEQSLHGNNSLYLGHPNYDVLGWCRVIKGKFRHNYILLYRKVDSTIVKLYYPNSKNIYEKEKEEQTARAGTFDDWYFPTFYYLEFGEQVIIKTLDKEVRDKGKLELQQFLREVEQKGQIYI